MKTIIDKEIKVQGSDTLIYYSELIMTVVKSMNQNEGFNYDTLKKIQRVDEVCQKKGEMKFEDSDFDFIKEKLANMKWAFFDKVFIDFTEYINGGGETK